MTRRSGIAARVLLHAAILFQLDKVRKHGARRGRMQALVRVRIKARHDFGNGADALANAAEILIFLSPSVTVALPLGAFSCFSAAFSLRL